MTTKVKMDFRHKHRAVAPIIATLLMVAISVVGGILIFVFAQGFFTDASIQVPSIEAVEIFGYDARDSATLRPHNFDTTELTVSNAADGKLSNTDTFALYVRNKGGSAVTISKVTVFGTDYTLAAAATCTATTVPATGSFSVSVGGTLASCSASSGVIGVGQEATLYVRYSSTANGPIKIGRPMIITMATGNGAIFTKQIQNGIQIGS